MSNFQHTWTWLSGNFPRVAAGVGVRVGLGLVYLVLEHEVFRETRLRSHDKILCSDWSPAPLSRRTCVQTRRSRQTIFQKRFLVCQKLCRNILFGKSNGKVRDTDMSLIWQRGYRYVFVRKTWTHVCERVFNLTFVCIRGDQDKLMHTDTSLYVKSCT